MSEILMMNEILECGRWGGGRCVVVSEIYNSAAAASGMKEENFLGRERKTGEKAFEKFYKSSENCQHEEMEYNDEIKNSRFSQKWSRND